MTETETFLYQKYGTIMLTLKQVATELNRTTHDGKPATRSIRTSINMGTFPVPTYISGRRRMADIRDVAAYLDKQRQGGKEKHEQEKAA